MRLQNLFPTSLSLVLLISIGCNKEDAPVVGDGAVGSGTVDPSQPVQPLPRHPHVQLSNLQFGQSFNNEETFSVDWTMPPEGDMSQFTLIVKPTNGPNRMELTDWFNGTSGTVSGQVESFGTGGGSSLASGCEVYLVSKEGDLEFKVSNSLTSGNAPVSEPRAATEADLAKLEQDLNALPPEAAAFVPIPEGLILSKDTPVKCKIGSSLIDATVVSHDPVSGQMKVYRPDARMEMLGMASDYMIDPKVLEPLLPPQ